MKYLVFTTIFLSFYLSGCKDRPEKIYKLNAEQQYFMKIALGSEFGGGNEVLKKWGNDINIFVNHDSQTELLMELDQILSELNALSSTITFNIVPTIEEANFVIFLTDANTYGAYETSTQPYLDGNWGMVWIYWNGANEIYKGSMYVDIVRNTDLNCMKHLLREELTQGLGLLNDSYDYEASIFYQGWTCTPSYAEIDKAIISMQLGTKTMAGMDYDDLFNLFAQESI